MRNCIIWYQSFGFQMARRGGEHLFARRFAARGNDTSVFYSRAREEDRRHHRRFAAGGNGYEQRDPRDIVEIKRLRQRVRDLEEIERLRKRVRDLELQREMRKAETESSTVVWDEGGNGVQHQFGRHPPRFHEPIYQECLLEDEPRFDEDDIDFDEEECLFVREVLSGIIVQDAKPIEDKDVVGAGQDRFEIMTSKEKVYEASSESLDPYLRKTQVEKYGLKYGCGDKGGPMMNIHVDAMVMGGNSVGKEVPHLEPQIMKDLNSYLIHKKTKDMISTYLNLKIQGIDNGEAEYNMNKPIEDMMDFSNKGSIQRSVGPIFKKCMDMKNASGWGIHNISQMVYCGPLEKQNSDKFHGNRLTDLMIQNSFRSNNLNDLGGGPSVIYGGLNFILVVQVDEANCNNVWSIPFSSIPVDFQVPIVNTTSMLIVGAELFWRVNLILNRWSHVSYDPGGIDTRPDAMTSELELCGQVMVIMNGNCVDVPFDPGGCGSDCVAKLVENSRTSFFEEGENDAVEPTRLSAQPVSRFVEQIGPTIQARACLRSTQLESHWILFILSLSISTF